MDTLAVHATKLADHRYCVRWRWHPGNTRTPIGGSVIVNVQPVNTEDVAALAELRALFYLLEERQIQGEGRKGNNLTIEQSFSSVKKALAKKSLKASGMGRTEKRHIAAATEFLATKYFAAKVIAEPQDREFEFKQFNEESIELLQDYPRIKLPCDGFDGGIIITRHALHRQVGRIDQNRPLGDEDDLSAVDDARFVAAWRWITAVLSGDMTEEMHLRSDVGHVPEHYKSARYLYFQSSTPKAVLAINKDADGSWVLTTILRTQHTSHYLDWPKTMAGQILMRRVPV